MVRIPLLLARFLAPRANVGNITVLAHRLLGGLARVAVVCAQVLIVSFWAANHHLGECRLQELYVVPIGSSHDYRQRDSTRVDEQASFGPFFFPDP